MKLTPTLLVTSALSLSPVAAWAHVSIASGVAFADKSQEVTFGVGHGCEGADTYRVRVELPAAVKAVRAETSDFGRATVEKNAAGDAVAVTWQKPDADLLDGDDNYYKLVIRFRIPNAPFTTLAFPTRQTCRDAQGVETTVDWTSTAEGQGEPAPILVIVPARLPGWNKVTVPADVDNLATYFTDAAIVWKGSAAFSSNPATVEQIGKTAGVTALTALSAGDEIWVKY